MTQSAAIIETKWSWVFTRRIGAWEVTTAAPSRGSQHPLVSLPMAPKRWTFARNHLRHTTVPWSAHRHQNGPPEHDLGAATNPRIPRRALLATHTTKEKIHHHRSAARRRVDCMINLPEPPPRLPQARTSMTADSTTTSSLEWTRDIDTTVQARLAWIQDAQARQRGRHGSSRKQPLHTAHIYRSGP
jgi:hypothetical protein